MSTTKLTGLALALCLAAALAAEPEKKSAMGDSSASGTFDCKKGDVIGVLKGHDGATIPNRCKSLFLTSNLITMDSAGRLGAQLGTHKYIKEVWFYNNKLGDRGTARIASLLKVNNVLEGLNIDKNNVGNQGAVQIAKALASNKNSKLERLALSFNKIGDKGVAALVDAIGTNGTDVYPGHTLSNVKELVLRDNEIKGEGAQALMALAKCNTHIEKIVTDGNAKLKPQFNDMILGYVMANSQEGIASGYKAMKIEKCKEFEKRRQKVASGEMTELEMGEELQALEAARMEEAGVKVPTTTNPPPPSEGGDESNGNAEDTGDKQSDESNGNADDTGDKQSTQGDKSTGEASHAEL